MKRITAEEFIDEGTRLFGDRGRDWAFRCPGCGTAQTAGEFVDLGLTSEKALRRIAFSCIGRVQGATKGCDWTLGGLFRIHQLEVLEAGVYHPRFEFATPENEPGPDFRPMGKRVSP